MTPEQATALRDPINRIVWVDARTLQANHYNPNMVMDPELDLIETSLMTSGWVHPLIIKAGDLWIIDGFHRWRISCERPRVVERYAFMVPVTMLDVSMAEAMMLTVRINRAKGTHAAVRMGALGRALIDAEGCDPQEVAAGIGATLAEVKLLYEQDIFIARGIKDYRYSTAWVPGESDHDAQESKP